MKITQAPSPNFNARQFPTAAGHSAIKLIILHYTDLPTATASRVLMQDPAHKACAHYLVDVDGSIEQLVADHNRAWHAGKSYWAGEEDLNSISIGIEIQNAGHRGGCQPYPEAQIAAVIELCQYLIKQHTLDAQAVIGHSDIAPARKIDPGEWFPWHKLADCGIGYWPQDSASPPTTLDAAAITALLVQCGYDPRLDLNTTLTAFQRHFVPEIFATPDLVGTPDTLTIQRLARCAAHAQTHGKALALA